MLAVVKNVKDLLLYFSLDNINSEQQSPIKVD